MHGVASEEENEGVQSLEKVMEVDVDGIGVKRKDRSPLKEVDIGDYGKKQRKVKAVEVFSKIIAK